MSRVLVTPHFFADEFDSHDDVPYPPEWIADRLTPLCRVLERVRLELGNTPCSIVSGYRSPTHNAELRANDLATKGESGVAQNSQHPQGRAADVSFVARKPALVLATALRLQAAGELPELGGIAGYPGWVHFDVRPKPADGHLARWTGKGFGSEPVA